jgi:TetR/AcrR family transcriptional regulator
MNMPSLDGAVVLVTGANGGIGTHFVHQALARGAAKVYATARTPRTWDDERVVPLTLDVTDGESIAAAVAAAPDVTALINNAGANPPSASLLEVTEADIRANMEINFFGPVLLARAFAPVLAANPRSILVDVHSVASWYGFGGVYSAAKAALWSATNSLRLELAPRGVHVTGVHMGYVETRMAAHADGPKMAPADLVTKVRRRRGKRVRGHRRRADRAGQGGPERPGRGALPGAPRHQDTPGRRGRMSAGRSEPTQQRRAAAMPLASKSPSKSPGRRERNKQEKLDRITAAASELFAERGVDEVTTQEIADKADIGAGTLFLYAKSKGELLLLVQNSTYADALAQGRSAAEGITDTLDAVMAIVRPVVECNRKQVDNGRTYLREIVFGDPAEPHHRDALDLTVQTEEAIAAVLRRDGRTSPQDAAARAHIVSAIMFISMAATINAANPVDDVVQEIRDQVRVLLPE